MKDREKHVTSRLFCCETEASWQPKSPRWPASWSSRLDIRSVRRSETSRHHSYGHNCAAVDLERTHLCAQWRCTQWLCTQWRTQTTHCAGTECSAVSTDPALRV